ncbi:MAG: hypothetical protein PHP89_02040 [Candidatus Omnitrophica bacterium]|nr:hypothetical protein [Candidatus Omnitrophota bacterium]MDD3988010.1 hypothetical protein [Candidatus Omnitrophota bacterium]MDD5665209.1 hypothetical protein [Candidatus Omnitrophota bacterium]
MLALSLILIGILLRFMPHADNFTPVAAIALFAGAYLKRRHAVIVPLVLMAVSDIFIGMHNVLIFTWGSFILASLLGLFIRKNKSFLRITGMSLLSSLVFFIVTNFGVWVMGWYPPTLAGLVNCYIMGLPFLRDFTVSTLLYSAVFFTAYEVIARRVKETRLAKVLL